MGLVWVGIRKLLQDPLVMNKKAFTKGFIEKCCSLGVNPKGLLKACSIWASENKPEYKPFVSSHPEFDSSTMYDYFLDVASNKAPVGKSIKDLTAKQWEEVHQEAIKGAKKYDKIDMKKHPDWSGKLMVKSFKD